MDAGTGLGEQFAQALAKKDFDRILTLFDPEVDFRGVTPRRFWEADDPTVLVTEVLQTWFDDSDEIEALEKLETDTFADRERVAAIGSGSTTPKAASSSSNSSTSPATTAESPGCAPSARAFAQWSNPPLPMLGLMSGLAHRTTSLLFF